MVASRGRSDRPSDRAFWHPDDHKLDRSVRTVNKMSGSCTSPVPMSVDKSIDHERHVRCRNCPGCLRARRFLWTMRAEAEWWQAERSWFFTGTFKDQTADYDVVRQEVTRFLKRVRKRSEDKVRYLILPEPHKSGMLHVHGLIHGKETLKYRQIHASWQAGFSVVKLAKDHRTAGYVCKYSTKGLHDGPDVLRPRIRASRAPTYGGWVMQRDELLVKKLLAERGEEEVAEIWRKNMRMVLTRPPKLRAEAFLRNLMTDL